MMNLVAIFTKYPHILAYPESTRMIGNKGKTTCLCHKTIGMNDAEITVKLLGCFAIQINYHEYKQHIGYPGG